MDRREAIRRAAMLMGGSIAAPTIMGVLNGCTAKPTVDWKPSFLSQDQGILITQLVDIIIPKTDTPGARDVGIPGFIDLMIKDVYKQDEKDYFLEGLTTFDEGANKKYGDPFVDLNPDQQLEYVKDVHASALGQKFARNGQKKPFILTVKELTLLGFFTSEVGATQVLQYDPVPGAYKGCLSLEEVGKTWAT